MNCKIINGLNLQRSFKDKDYKYIIFDINSLTIVPHLNNTKYESSDHIIITPFLETFKLYLSYKKVFPLAKFIFIIDGGISPIILNLLPEYKKDRGSRRYTGNIRTMTSKVYDYNILLISKLFEYLQEVIIDDINRNEADFIIGYVVNKLSENNKCLVMSHDKDLLLTFNKSENVDVVYKQTSMKVKGVTYFLVDTQDCINHIINFQYLKNTKELLYYRALVGDSSDKIPKPFGIKSVKIINNLFEDAYMNDIEVTYEYIISYFTEKFKKLNPNIISKFSEDLRKNILIMNIFNFDILSSNEKIKLNSYLDEIMYEIKDKIEINSIYELFETYGLYLQKEDLDNTFKYLKGTI